MQTSKPWTPRIPKLAWGGVDRGKPLWVDLRRQGAYHRPASEEGLASEEKA